VLLGDEPVLDVKVRFYQRLLARDQDEATELVEEYLGDHSCEEVYDHLLLPALCFARRDRESQGLSPEDERSIYQTIRAILEDVVAPQQEISLIASKQTAPNGLDDDRRASVLILGCPAQDEADETALHAFAQLLRGKRCRVEVLSADVLTAEVMSRVGEEQPALVCAGALPPGGLAQARYLCKRLRAQFPDLRILVGRWGQTDNVEKTRERLQAAGANHVATTLLEARTELSPYLQAAALSQPHNRVAAQPAAH
jgi:hypothetical protein